ncbi:putative 2-dehydropantoate 2-reductase [Gloeobacter morelensis]|uniref:2-dehydropantoate 2-reductase n=1 Tax=Gloeobacter morelensis MG652769 TaxID=2781736 RepID=A0ABY3PRN0_9CYAN|nr:putative 2-dehydropantoate 2-reductase [Gloeobacter morelensis]UFP96276.1 putative 2-dehydropantoate 2-reductase [Gloeobacter morelensis MG652769]
MIERARRYAVLGTGAVGGYYGALLQRSGFEVHFLARSDCEHIARYGLAVRSPMGDFVLPKVHVYSEAGTMPRCEVVLVTLKATHNHLLASMLPSVVAQGGTVVLMQNGLGGEAEIFPWAAGAQILGGLPFICVNKTAPGQIHHIDYGLVTLGAFGPDYAPQGQSPVLLQVAEDLQQAGIAVETAADLMLARWRKLVWNIPYNGLSVLLNARTDQLMENPATAALAEQLMAEVKAGARACGRDFPDAFIEKMLDHTRAMQPYRTSMKIDAEQGRPLEVETIYGHPLRIARRAGAQMPRVEMLYRQLQFVDARIRTVGKVATRA